MKVSPAVADHVLATMDCSSAASFTPDSKQRGPISRHLVEMRAKRPKDAEHFFGAEVESNQTLLLRHHVIDVATGATLNAHVMFCTAAKFWRFPRFPLRTASREDDTGDLQESVNLGVSESFTLPPNAVSFSVEYRGFLAQCE